MYAELLGKMLEIVCLGTTAQDRVRKGKDLGEDLSTAHALALAVLGHDVILHIDEGRGRAEAKRAVKRMMDGYAETGIITVTDSAKLLKGCREEWFSSGRTHAEVWQRLCRYDDALDPKHKDFI